MKRVKHRFFPVSVPNCNNCGINWNDLKSSTGANNIQYFADKLCGNGFSTQERIDYVVEHCAIPCITEDEYIIKQIIE